MLAKRQFLQLITDNPLLCASRGQIERVRKEMEESDRLLKDRLQRAEAQRLELEDELSRCKMNMANERLVTDDQLSSAKQRIRTEEVSLVQH